MNRAFPASQALVRRARPVPRTVAAARGFTLISVLLAMVVSALGILAIVRMMTRVTSTSTQNQALSTMAPVGNSFWAMVQSNPTLLDNASFAGTYTSVNYTSAPAAMQPWLRDALVADAAATPPIARPPLPSGTSLSIVTSADANGSACSSANGCTVKLTVSWAQDATFGMSSSTRTQTLYFQFPG